jgi:hypothetical protein
VCSCTLVRMMTIFYSCTTLSNGLQWGSMCG